MDVRVLHLFLATIATILFMTAIGYNGWKCGESLLSPLCIKLDKRNEITGALLLTAGLLVFIAGAFILVYLLKGSGGPNIAATVATFIAAILASVAMFFYHSFVIGWSPFIATMAMSLTIALAIMLIFQFV
ncbi:unnamed protein product [Rodentolepis nana]|uniref:Transmembrane protein n=1 Tax=Rodentolepis nana TaxID=102285 RepID=A0A0R3TVB6_RODNA|nr:unnamed protein product [Rodentolepis nana]